MILATDTIIKAIVTFCVIVAMVLLFRGIMQKKWLTAGIALIVVFVVVAEIISVSLGYLAVYIFTIVFLSGCMSLLIRRAWKDGNELGPYLARNGYRFLYAMIALLCFTIMVKYSGCEDFWYDDLCQLGYITYPHSFGGVIAAEALTPPLSRIIEYFWYQVAPYGKSWLVLPCELAAAGTIYLTGLCGKRIKNTLTGAVTAILVGLNISTINGCAYEIRPYPFYLFFSALSLYLYIRRVQEENNSLQSGLLLGAVMALNGYTHYFGIFFSGAMFLFDCCLIAKKTERKNAWPQHFIPYVTALVLYVPWIIFYFVTKLPNSLGWPAVPNWEAVKELIHTLNGNLDAIKYLFTFGVVVSVVRFAFGIFRKDKKHDLYLEILPLFLIVIIIGGVYLYATQIAWKSTFWVDRYFYGLIPCVMLVCAIGVNAICGVFQQMNHPSSKVISSVICTCLAIVIIPKMMNSIAYEASTEYETPGKVANWLYSKPNIMDKKTLIICSDSTIQSGFSDFQAAQEGWIEYYLRRQSKREAPTVENVHDVSERELLQHNIIYVYRMHNDTFPKEFEVWMTNNFNLVETGCENSWGEIRAYAYLKKSILSNEQLAETNTLKAADILQYLSLLSNKDYTVFMAVCDNAGCEVSDGVRDALISLGMMNMNDANGASYLAVFDGGELAKEETSSTEAITYDTSLNGAPVTIESAGWAMGSQAGITINGIEYLLPTQRGLGIVVYDNEANAVLDSVTWDIYHGLNTAYRQ